jgi:hypothetical protein
LDAIKDLHDIVVKQEQVNSNANKVSRNELYRSRDQSGLCGREFYLQLAQGVEINDRIEVSGQ